MLLVQPAVSGFWPPFGQYRWADETVRVSHQAKRASIERCRRRPRPRPFAFLDVATSEQFHRPSRSGASGGSSSKWREAGRANTPSAASTWTTPRSTARPSGSTCSTRTLIWGPAFRGRSSSTQRSAPTSRPLWGSGCDGRGSRISVSPRLSATEPAAAHPALPRRPSLTEPAAAHPPLPPGTPRRTHSAPTPSAPPGPSRTASTVRRRPAICQAPPLPFLLPSAPWLKLPLAVVPCRLSDDHQGPAGSKHERVGRSQRPSHPLLPDPDGRRVHKGRLRNAVAGLRRRLEPRAS